MGRLVQQPPPRPALGVRPGRRTRGRLLRSTTTLLQEPQPPPIESVLTTLLNDLGAIASDIVLVLDDYHVIDTRDVPGGIAFLLGHLPPQLLGEPGVRRAS